MRSASTILAVTILAVLSSAAPAVAKSAVSRAHSKYAHVALATERAQVAAPTATTTPIAKAATSPR